MSEYENSKQREWEAFWEGYATGRGGETHKPIVRETARTQFKRYWRLNRTE